MLQWKMLASKVMHHDNPQRPLVIPTEWYMGEIRKSLSPNQTSILGAVEGVNFIIWKLRNSL